MLTGNRVTPSGRGVNEEIACEKMKDPNGHVGFAFIRDGPLAGPRMRPVDIIFQIQWNLKTTKINQNRWISSAILGAGVRQKSIKIDSFRLIFGFQKPAQNQNSRSNPSRLALFLQSKINQKINYLLREEGEEGEGEEEGGGRTRSTL